MHVEGGDRVGIGGFIVTGAAPKRLIVRAIGPSLTRNGLIDVLADPVLELHGPTGFVTITNDNWRDTQEAEIQATGLPPTNNLESAIVATLPPGVYTAIVRGNGATAAARSGLALVELYDLDQTAGSKLGNISTRASVGIFENIVIAGFILGGNPPQAGSDRVILRGIGPSLIPLGVANALAAAIACSNERALAESAAAAFELDRQRAHLLAGLGEGVSAYGVARGPFVLVRVEGAAAIRAALRERGYAVRRGDTFPGLGPDWLRIAVRPEAVTDGFLKVWRDVFG